MWGFRGGSVGNQTRCLEQEEEVQTVTRGFTADGVTGVSLLHRLFPTLTFSSFVRQCGKQA